MGVRNLSIWLQVLRWALVVSAGGFALYLFSGIFSLPGKDSGVIWQIVAVCLAALFALPFLLISYFGVRADYRRLLTVVSFLFSTVLLFGVMALISHFEVREWLHSLTDLSPGRGWNFFVILAVIAAGFGLLVLPFYAAAKTFVLLERYGHGWLSRRSLMPASES